VITPILISPAAFAGAVETGATSAIARAATSAVLIEDFFNI
jgi:hypothetical protein